MKTFHTYVKIKESTGRDVGAAALGDVSFGGTEKDSMAALIKLSRLAWDRNREQMLSLFGRMAAQDQDIKTALEELTGDKASVSRAVRKAAGLDSLDDEMDKDEITPSGADKNGGGGEDDDGGM